MKLYKCSNCNQAIFFENDHCGRCNSPLGFTEDNLTLNTLVPLQYDSYKLFDNSSPLNFRYCSNHQYGVCNWLIPVDSTEQYCKACRLNHTIPDLNKPEFRQRWLTIETAKHRMVYTLLKLGLQVISKREDVNKGLQFDFKADDSNDTKNKVMTGHDNGLITLNISEADDIERAMMRRQMDEVYRTVLGHFRHEVGHYYWELLIDKSKWLDEYRQLFGDDRQDYQGALNKHYNEGAPADWNEHYISKYATMHPWEDWAETWAHYMHIMDTLETAFSYGITINANLVGTSSLMNATISWDPFVVFDFNYIIDQWLPLTYAMNSLNRSMGLNDIYPFVIYPDVIKKLSFIHKVCMEQKNQFTA